MFSSSSLTLITGFLYTTIIMLEYDLSVPNFLRAFYYEVRMNFIKEFSVSIEINCNFFLGFIYVLYYIYCYIELSLYLWNEMNLIIICV